MSFKIKKGVNPIETRHIVPTFIGGKGLTQPVYAVYAIKGSGTAMPSDGIFVFLKYAGGKSQYTYPPTMCVTLEYLASDCPPETEEDTFWEDGAQDGKMLTLAQATDIIRAKINQSSLQV